MIFHHIFAYLLLYKWNLVFVIYVSPDIQGYDKWRTSDDVAEGC